MQVATVAGAVLGGIVVIAIVYVVGMRRESRLVHGPLIRLQRAIINPRQLQSAGRPGAYAAVIRHRGRTSGQAYETPVGVVAVDGGFLIALVYGPRTSWCRNVLASGSATIVHDGNTYVVDRPEIVPMKAVAAHFPAGDQRGFRWLGVDQALRVHRVESDESGAPGAEVARDGGAAASAAGARPAVPVLARSVGEALP